MILIYSCVQIVRREISIVSAVCYAAKSYVETFETKKGNKTVFPFHKIENDNLLVERMKGNN